MEKKFKFIDGTKNDRFTLRSARSHAMKGRNLGKTHRRRSRLDTDQLHKKRQLTHLRVSDSQRYEESSNTPVQGSLGLTYKSFGDELLSVSFPIETTPQSRDIIYQFFTLVAYALYPPQLCLSLDQVTSHWFRVLFMDETSYHCSLALLAEFNEFFFGREIVSSKAVYHLNQAVRLVKQSLQTTEALSNSNLAVVNCLIVQELLREAQPKAEVHSKGLQKMVELRGGLSQLGEDSLLALKICKTDIDCALCYGTSTRFFRDRMFDVARSVASQGFCMNRNVAGSDPRFHRMDPFLQQILVDVTDVARLFNMDSAALNMDPNMFQEVIVSVGYRLIRFHPFGGPQLEAKLEPACHIGLVAFTTTLYLQFGRRRFLRYRLVAQRLQEVIERGLDLEDNDLMLWLLFIGGVSVLAEVSQIWLVSRIYQVTQSLDIEDWTALHKTIVRFPWINCLHDEAGKALWNTVMKGQNEVRNKG